MGQHVERDTSPEATQIVRVADRTLAMNPFEVDGGVG